MHGTLYIVATPIGNLEDITLRALRILKEADLILAEDTRITKKLMMYYNVDKSILSYHQHSSDEKKLEILARLIRGENMALVSDAGTPGISDPGNELIDFILERSDEIRIVPIPGASAVVTALSVSGFRADKFIFLGFLPKKKKNKLYEWLKEGPSASRSTLSDEPSGSDSKSSGRTITFAFYESPHRLLKTLSELKEYFASEAKPRNDRPSRRVRISKACRTAAEPGSREVRSGGGGDRRVLVARELTKLHETLYRGNIQEVIEKIGNDRVKGEVVVIVEG